MHTTKLISITPDAEDLVAYCARVSNPANQHSKETAPRLLRYLIKHILFRIYIINNIMSICFTNHEVNSYINITHQ